MHLISVNTIETGIDPFRADYNFSIKSCKFTRFEGIKTKGATSLTRTVGPIPGLFGLSYDLNYNIFLIMFSYDKS